MAAERGFKMSVSVFAEMLEGNVSSVLECSCGAWRSSAFASRAEAYAALEAGSVVSECRDDYCYAEGVLYPADEVAEPEVNLSNLNAAEVFPLLGISLSDEGWCGSLPAEDFKGRVLVALALAPEDLGRAAEPTVMFGLVGTIAAREAGYVQSRLAKMLEVADYALAGGREVCWG